MARTRRDRSDPQPEDVCEHGEVLGYWCPWCEEEWTSEDEREESA